MPLRQIGEQGEMQGRFLVRRRNAHQAGDFQAVLRPAPGQEIADLLRKDAGLLRFRAGVDLDIAARMLVLFRHFLRQGDGQLGPVHGLDHIEQGHGFLDLVGLERPDQVKLDIGMAFPLGRELGLGLLHPVLTEHALAGGQGRFQLLDRLDLADRDQGDACRIAAGRLAASAIAFRTSARLAAISVEAGEKFQCSSWSVLSLIRCRRITEAGQGPQVSTKRFLSIICVHLRSSVAKN